MLSRQESVALDEKNKNYAWIHVHICRLPGDGRTSNPNNGSDAQLSKYTLESCSNLSRSFLH